MTSEYCDRVSALLPQLQRTARRLVSSSPDHDADDLVQEMALAILERASGDFSFLEQSNAYVVQYGAWTAQHAAESARTYRRYVSPEPQCTDEDGEQISLLELLPCPNQRNPEDIYAETQQIEALIEIVRSLSPKDRRIVKMLYLGYSKVEIARRLSISKQAVNGRRNVIANALQAVV